MTNRYARPESRDRCGAPAAPPTLSTRKVCLSFGMPPNDRILRNIDLDVREGEFLCIVGPSGSGKTTLLRLIAGLLQPTSGAVEFEGQPVTGPSRSRAVVFQDYVNALLPWRTVAGNVALASRCARYRRRNAVQPSIATACEGRACATSPTSSRASSPAACSSGCRSRAAWRRSRRSC